MSGKLKRVVLKEEMVAVTGDAIKALVLNQMVYWTEILNESDRELVKQIDEYKKLGLDHKVKSTEKQLRNGWFWKSAQELSEELMGISSRGSIDRKLKELITDNFIQTRKNPKKWDKTNHYRVDLDFLRIELKKLGYALDGYAIPEDEISDDKEKPEESPEPRIAQNEQSRETLIQPIAHNEQSTAHNEQSIAHSEQTIPEITSETSYQEITSKESIYLEQIKNIDLPSLTKLVLTNQIDRLILFNINLLEVELTFKTNHLIDKHFANVLDNVLKVGVKSNFKNMLQTSIDTFIKNASKKAKGNGRTEQEPNWAEEHDKEVAEKLKQTEQAKKTSTPEEQAAKKKSIEEKLKAFRA